MTQTFLSRLTYTCLGHIYWASPAVLLKLSEYTSQAQPPLQSLCKPTIDTHRTPTQNHQPWPDQQGSSAVSSANTWSIGLCAWQRVKCLKGVKTGFYPIWREQQRSREDARHSWAVERKKNNLRISKTGKAQTLRSISMGAAWAPSLFDIIKCVKESTRTQLQQVKSC